MRVAVAREHEERAGDPGEGRRHPERERLVDRQVDARGDRRDLAVPDRAKRAAHATPEQQPPAREEKRRAGPTYAVEPPTGFALDLNSHCAAGEMGELADELRHRDGDGERREREVDAREPEGWHADDDPACE